MKKMLMIVVLIFLAQNSYASGRYHVGYEDIQKPYQGRIWYPISSSIKEDAISGSPIFKIYYAKKDAPISDAAKKLPLLILSHGNGGTVYRLDWIADYFVRRGWIVAGINHPGNTFGDTSDLGFVQVWKRPGQISKFLDFLLNENPFASRIDRARIAAAGHSAGGTTVLLLAGARMSKELFARPLPQCDLQLKGTEGNCANMKKINFNGFDKDEIEADYRDSRIKAIVALDPGFALSFPQGQKSSVPLHIFFADKLMDPADEIYARDFLKVFGDTPHSTISGSIHISFLSECSEEGLKKDVPICMGDADRRSSIHKEANQLMFRFLEGQK